MRAAVLDEDGLVTDILEIETAEDTATFGALTCPDDVNIGWTRATDGTWSIPAGSPLEPAGEPDPVSNSLVAVMRVAEVPSELPVAGVIPVKLSSDAEDRSNDLYGAQLVSTLGAALLEAETGADARGTIAAAAAGANGDITALTGLTQLLLGGAAIATRSGATSVTPPMQSKSDASSSGILVMRAADGGLSRYYLARSRGTLAAPTAVQTTDTLGEITWSGHDGVQMTEGARIAAVVASVPASDSMPTDLIFRTSPGGTTTPVERLRITAAGALQVGGTNTVVDPARLLYLRPYTWATLPAASACACGLAWCSDLGGGGGPVVSDGTAWRRVCRGGTQVVVSDATVILVPQASAPTQFDTATLTANRSVTLNIAGAVDGDEFEWVRTGSGAFTRTFAGKALSTGQWARARYSSADTSWHLVATGSL